MLHLQGAGGYGPPGGRSTGEDMVMAREGFWLVR